MKYLIEIDIPEASIARYREEFPQAAKVPDREFEDRVLDSVIAAMGEMCVRHGHQFDKEMKAPTLLNTYVIRRLASKSGVKITLLVRTPGMPTRDFCMTDDDLDDVIAAIERRKGQGS